MKIGLSGIGDAAAPLRRNGEGNKNKGDTQWETKAEKRARTKARNKRKANRNKRPERYSRNNRRALRKGNQD